MRWYENDKSQEKIDGINSGTIHFSPPGSVAGCHLRQLDLLCHLQRTKFTVGIFDNNLMTNENTMKVKTLERCFIEGIDKEMSKIVDTVKDRIQNAILTAIDSIVAPEIELATRSINASSGRDATSITANSECGEHIGITVPFENVSEKNNTLHVLSTNDETRNNITDEVSELSVTGTHFDRQPHTHHSHLDKILITGIDDFRNSSVPF